MVICAHGSLDFDLDSCSKVCSQPTESRIGLVMRLMMSL